MEVHIQAHRIISSSAEPALAGAVLSSAPGIQVALTESYIQIYQRQAALDYPNKIMNDT